MGSESSGGGGGSTYDDAPMQRARQERQRKKEERRVLQAEQEDQKGYYVRSGGNIVRSSSGTAVTSKAGAKVVDDYRSQEVEETLGGQKSTVAQLQLEKRLRDTPFVGTIGLMAKKNLERQLADLKAGGTAQFRRTSTGRYVATGVNRPGQEGDSSPNIANNPAYSIGDGGDSAGGVARRAVASQQTQTTASDVSGGTARKLLGQSASGVKRRKIYEFGR